MEASFLHYLPCSTSLYIIAIELDKEANAEAIRAEFGNGIWIRGRFIANLNELSTLDKKGELDELSRMHRKRPMLRLDDPNRRIRLNVEALYN